MSEEKKDHKDCPSCKHFVYEPKAAHKNRCKLGGQSAPVAVVRVAGGKCDKGKKHEAKA